MSDTPGTTRNWFDQGGKAYAQHRPGYPSSLAEYLSSHAPAHRLAVDVGCGNGQLTRLLARHFTEVAGIDPSADQLAHAAPQAGVRYHCAPAEALPLPGHCADLVTVAQAVHWFRLEEFYQEVRRVAARGALLALVCYGTFRTDEALMPRIDRFYGEELGPYWPPERSLIEAGYSTLPFPFEELRAPALELRVEWNLSQLLGYLSTWSAVRRAREDGREAMLADFSREMTEAWGPPQTTRQVVWPLPIRLGRVD